MAKSPSKSTRWQAPSLFLFTVLSRIPFRSRILYHWDSVNFAYAMREFSIAKEQPQPPGYILYVWLSRLLNILVGDAQTTMVWISIFASALSVVALFYLGRAMFNEATGLVSALLLASSPLFWFYGEIALPHTLDAFLVILGVWWLYETMTGMHTRLYPAIVVLAIAGGVRQQTLVFLAPLILFALRKVGWKRFITAGVLGVIICIAWFIPLVTLNGGLAAYFGTMGAFSARFNATTSVFMGAGWWGIQRNLRKLIMYTAYGAGIALVPLLGFAALSLWRRLRTTSSHQNGSDVTATKSNTRGTVLSENWEKALFLMVWLLPTVLFYSFIHMGQQGLVFVFLPVLLLVSGYSLTTWMRTTHQPNRMIASAVTILVTINIAVFCFAPEYPLRSDRLRLLTRETIRHSDQYYQDRFEVIQENFPAATTAILAANWHHVEYYLPAYKSLHFDIVSKWEKGEGGATNSPSALGSEAISPGELGLELNAQGHTRIVIFDPDLDAYNSSTSSTQDQSLEHGGSLAYLVLDSDQSFVYDVDVFGILKD